MPSDVFSPIKFYSTNARILPHQMRFYHSKSHVQSTHSSSSNRISFIRTASSHHNQLPNPQQLAFTLSPRLLSQLKSTNFIFSPRQPGGFFGAWAAVLFPWRGGVNEKSPELFSPGLRGRLPTLPLSQYHRRGEA